MYGRFANQPYTTNNAGAQAMTNEEVLKLIEKAKASGETLLDLRSKRLTTLPPELFQLTSLTKLYLSNNQLAALPPELFQMKNLTGLDLGGLKLTTLPLELFQLTNLAKLYLHDNQLTTLPPEIGQLRKLQELYLWGNTLTTLPQELFQITNLTKLYLSRNQLITLPQEICQLTKLKYLHLDNNPLTSPPLEIAEQGINAIRRYFASLKLGDQPLNEVKVLLVGDGAAGKTSLVKQLLGEAFNQHEDTTHGISIRGWQPDTGNQQIKVNIWDFGGQEIMHATHQFFLSKRSLYVLVLDGRKDERAEYWLRHIESFGGDSPVLIVLNKHDANPSFDLDRLALLRKFPGIKGFCRTSCADGHGIGRFRDALLKELAQVPMIGIRWPQSWFAVKQRLEQMPQPYISCDEYAIFCADAGVAGEENRETLVDFLHDLGVAVHFRELELKDTHVLDPKWVTAAVYKIINAKQVADSGGILDISSLTGILRRQTEDAHDFPASKHRYIIELMKQFELCYDLDKQRALIPQLLPVAEPDFSFDYASSLQFAFLYEDFLPLSVLPRFMVKLHKDIKGEQRWRTGVVLQDKDGGAQAAVKADYEKRRISLWVSGPRRKEYLHFLWYSLREINASFEKLRVRERVPMPDDPERTADYETLLKHAKRDSDIYYAEGSDKEYSVKELLGLVQPELEEETLRLLRKIDNQTDDRETKTEAFNSLFELKPNIAGIGLNLNEWFRRILAFVKQKRK
jgi:small GTP-binding protein